MKNLILTILISLFSFNNLYCQYLWSQKTSMPFSRYIASGFTIGNKAYVGTGYNSNIVTLSDWWQYDPNSDSWSQIASNASGRASAVTFTIYGKGYVGLGISGNQFLTDLHEYDPLTNTWVQKASLPAQGRFGCASFSIDDTGYICCGNFGSATGPYTNEVYAFNATTNTWNIKAPFPGISRYGVRGAQIDNFGYLTGGGNGDGGINTQYFSDLWQYDPINNSWIQKNNFPGTGRSYASVFSLDEQLIVGNGIHWSGFFSDFFSYDPINDIWSNLPSMPSNEARWAAAGFSIDLDGYVASGNQSFNNPIVTDNELWKLSLTTSSIESESNSGINIFPTLVTDQITVSYLNDLKECHRLIIHDESGKKCFNDLIHSNSTTIQILDYKPGLYIVNIFDENSDRLLYSKKLIKCCR